MNIIQTITMAFKSIANNKVRSFLTMLGIIIGVGAVISLVATIQGMQTISTMISQAQGSNKIQFGYYGSNSKVRQEMVDYASKDLGEYIEGISPAAQMYVSQGSYNTIKYRTKEMSDCSIYFGNEQYGRCTSNTIASGRDLTESDIENEARVCVIGEAVRLQFFGAMSPLDQKIKINGQSYKVVGVFAGKYGGKLNTPDAMILMPISLQLRVTGWENNDEYVARGKDRQSILTFCDKMKEYMSTKVQEQWDFNIYSNEQYAEMEDQQTNMMSIVGGGVAGISLLVGGIGIMNIMLVSVTERTREIGIRMAIGARRRDIIAQFLIEAAAVSSCGGLVGIAVGFFGSGMLGSLLTKQFANSPWLPELPSIVILPKPGLVIGAFLFSALLGIFFGIYPANKASKLQPVEALRTQ